MIEGVVPTGTEPWLKSLVSSYFFKFQPVQGETKEKPVVYSRGMSQRILKPQKTTLYSEQRQRYVAAQLYKS